MTVVQRSDTDGEDPLERYARFLKQQAEQAGLGARVIETRFAEEAKKEEEAACTGSRPTHPISDMNYSKSHIDRLFTAQALPKPPRPFTLQFLRITSRAAGLSQEEHQARCAEGLVLLDALRDSSSRQLPRRREEPASSPSAETVARLQLEVELERARHTETHLRYALRDTQFLVRTLWEVISALRDIISGNDAIRARASHDGADPAHLAEVVSQTDLALAHKRSAQEEVGRAAALIGRLEELWDRARVEVGRLSLYVEAGDLPAEDDSSNSPSLLPQDLLTRPALDDIAAALSRARTLNTEGEEAARSLYETLGTASEPHDEHAVLLAATRLSDADSRRAALLALVSKWSEAPGTREVLLRLAADDVAAVRTAVASCMKMHWWDAPSARNALLSLAQDGDAKVTVAAVDALATVDWRGPEPLDALLRLVGDQTAGVRLRAVQGLSKRWPNNRTFGDLLVQLLGDEDTRIRELAIALLLDNWPYDSRTRDALLRVVDDAVVPIVETALAGLIANWLHEPKPRAAVLRLDPEDSPVQAAFELVPTRWGQQAAARDSVIFLATTESAGVWQAWRPSIPDHALSEASYFQVSKERAASFRAAAVRMLAKGWGDDAVARNAIVGLAEDPIALVRRVAAGALWSLWANDRVARRALNRLAQDFDEEVRQFVRGELRWVPKT